MHQARISASILASLPLIAGHGGGMYYKLDGVVHGGTTPHVLNTTTGSIQRRWNVLDPFGDIYKDKPLTDPRTACGDTGLPYKISYHAPVRAGNTVRVNYRDPVADFTFAHVYGPLTAYMAACPLEGCEGVNLAAPMWFKIWEAGLVNGTYTEGHWAMMDMTNGDDLVITIPATLKPGKYLFKHDAINLQSGWVEVYPNCIQLDVSGTGDRLPKTEELVAFPGGYEKDYGVSWPPKGTVQGYDWFFVEHANDTYYSMPGPSLWQG